MNSAAGRASPITSGRGAMCSSQTSQGRPPETCCAASWSRANTNRSGPCHRPARKIKPYPSRRSMLIDERVLIAGAGPVGLVAAANLVQAGVPVTVFEAGADLSEESRASTFHPPTLDMLDRLGASAPLIDQGMIAPQVQYCINLHGLQ